MDLGISQKTALVLGGGGGLGSAIALAFAKEGANVVVADVNDDAIKSTCAQIDKLGVKTLGLNWDISDLSLVEEKISQIEQSIGSVDILINITGGPAPTPAAGQSPEVWEKNFKLMVLSVIAISDRVLPGMKAKGWGRIVTSTSSGVVSPIPNLGISNSLRMSLLGWSKTLAREVARDGITANVIVPGRVATGRIKFLDEQKAKREGRSVEDVAKESTSSIPVGRYGEPEEYANAVVFLGSSAASYITGSVMRVDGGLIASV